MDGLGRVWIVGLRTDSLYLFSTGIRVSQLVAAVSFLAAGGVLAWVLIKKKPTPDTLYVNRMRNVSQVGEKQADLKNIYKITDIPHHLPIPFFSGRWYTTGNNKANMLLKGASPCVFLKILKLQRTWP